MEDPGRVLAALGPEAEDPIQRSEINLEACDRGLLIEIQSEDLVSFRAALNTWIRLIDIASKMVKV